MPVMSSNEIKRHNLDEHEFSGKLMGQQREVLLCVQDAGKLTRNQVSEITGIRLTSVCGRAKTLLDNGLLTVGESIQCPVTGKHVGALECTDLGKAAAQALIEQKQQEAA